ncbi:MAG: hypothetical protein R3304_12865, partial [Longimicrobiales bacterium]|nr:hypothetical protein [Longimicrobiales bacterium]
PRVFVPIAEDAAALLGVVVAFLGVFLSRALQMPVLDAASSIVIGLILASVALFLAYETRGLLVGETIDDILEAKVRRVCREDPAVQGLERLLGVHLGPDDILLTMDVRFRSGAGREPVSRVVDRIERRIRAEDPRVRRIFVEPEGSDG